MCDCISKLEEKVKAELPLKNSEYANLKITSVSMDDVCLLFDSHAPTQLGYTMTIKHEPVGRKKETKLNILGNYCPFCGEKLLQEGKE